MKSLSTILATAALAMLTSRAEAQGIGVRAGVSATPDQFYLGVHYETKELLDRLRFRPNIEIGTGDGVTLTALNFELAYRLPFRRSLWSLQAGGGPALNIYSAARATHSEGGFNILIGLVHRQGLFTELKLGALDSPDVKFGIGYTFHR